MQIQRGGGGSESRHRRQAPIELKQYLFGGYEFTVHKRSAKNSAAREKEADFSEGEIEEAMVEFGKGIR